MQYSPEILNQAIVTKAAEDFRSALKRNKVSEIKYFERWFLSDWGQSLSGGLGEVIIERIKNEVGVIKKKRLRVSRKKA